MSLPDLINSAGVSLILIAFLLLTLKKVDSQSVAYNVLNLVGAGLACYGSVLIGAVPFVVLEGIWCLVAIYALIRRN